MTMPAIAATLTVDKPRPNSGDTVTATYAVTGLSPVQGTLTGSVKVNGVDTPVTVKMGDDVQYAVPVIAGLTFKPVDGKPGVFTAVVP